jgi:hypothetical protein
MFIGPLLYIMYAPARRFNQVIKALGSELLDLNILNNKTLLFKTVTYGEFYLYYDAFLDPKGTYYEIWITTVECGPCDENEDSVSLWKSDKYGVVKKDDKMEIPDYVPLSQVENIKYLLELKYESYRYDYRIVGIMGDRELRSEAPDLLRTLFVLRKIEKYFSK